MKIRQGFISNSSSTSFIAIFKIDNDKCPHCGRTDPNFLDILANISKDWENSDASRIESMDKETIIRTVMDDWDNETLSNEILHRNIGENEKISHFQISYHDDFIKNMFEELKINGKVEILYTGE